MMRTRNGPRPVGCGGVGEGGRVAWSSAGHARLGGVMGERPPAMPRGPIELGAPTRCPVIARAPGRRVDRRDQVRELQGPAGSGDRPEDVERHRAPGPHRGDLRVVLQRRGEEKEPDGEGSRQRKSTRGQGAARPGRPASLSAVCRRRGGLGHVQNR